MSRKRKPTVRLYDEQGNFTFHTSPEDAQEKLVSGLYEEAYEMRGDTPHWIGIKKRTKPGRPSLDGSSTSLTLQDVLANVGADSSTDESHRPVYRARGRDGQRTGRAGHARSATARAQNRINFWPYVHDQKAVYVPPRV